MALKITKSSEVIRTERLNTCLYSQPGSGKTTLAFSSEAPLLLDFDKGAHRAANRKDIVIINSWSDVESMSADDLAGYKTIVVDTVGRALDMLSVDIIRKNPKMGKGGGQLALQGYGELKVRFSAFLKLMNSFQKDVVLISHMDEQRNGDEIIERLDIQGSSKGEVYKSVDAMGRIFIRNGKRYLDFSPREGSFGKNPGQLPELEIPHPSASPTFLAETITAIKSKLNELSADQVKSKKEVDEWTLAIEDLSDVADFNLLLKDIKKAPVSAQALFAKAAKEKGFLFNKTSAAYEEPAYVA